MDLPKTLPFNNGFTLIEVLVALALIAVMGSFSLLYGFGFYRTTAFRNELLVLVSTLQQARARSLNMIVGSEHGVHIEPGKFVAFSGSPADYEIGASGNFEILAPGVSEVFGDLEIVFEQRSGQAGNLERGQLCGNEAQSCVMRLAREGQSHSIYINREGALQW